MAKNPTSVCIPEDVIEEIKKLNLLSMNSQQREAALRNFVGDSAGEITLIYEKTLTLINQKKSLIKFIQNIDGVSLKKKEELQKQTAKRLQDKTDIINDSELSSIIKEVLDNKYNIKVSLEEVAKISKLRKEASELSKVAKGTPDGSDEKLLLGHKLAEANSILEKEINKDSGILSSLKASGARIKESFGKGIGGGVGTTLIEVTDTVLSPTLKGIKASLDASGLTRQGMKVFAASPTVWVKMVGKNWKSWSNVGSKKAMEKVRMAADADLLTRDLYQDAVEAKLDINVQEDFFKDSNASKIPILGNFFQASDDAYSLSMRGARMDLFEKYVNIFKEANGGKMPDKKGMESFARVANSVTGRGGLGKLEAFSGELNKILFSARYQTAQINTIRHAFDSSLSKEARVIAQKNLFKTFALYFGLMQTFDAFGGEVGWNPSQSTFGKVKMPGSKKWIDLTGGMAQYLSLPFKLGSKISKGKPAFGQDSAFNVLVNFSAGKFAPAPGVLRDFLAQKDYQGKQPTTLSSLKNLFAPITLDNVIQDFKKEEDLNKILFSFILEFLGTSVSNPNPKKLGKSPLDSLMGK